MKRVLKYIAVLFLYIFLVIEGFVGGGTTNTKDIWNDLIKWAKK